MATLKAQSDVLIKASAEEVFKYLTDLRLIRLWNPNMRSVNSTDTLKLGSVYETESIILRDIKILTKNKVIGFNQNKLLELENSFGMVCYKASFSLSSLGRQTAVNCKINILTKGLMFGLTTPVLKQLAQHEILTDLELLKIAVENRLGI